MKYVFFLFSVFYIQAIWRIYRLYRNIFQSIFDIPSSKMQPYRLNQRF
jgi:hypothetical protein